ncbi:hypothetical protein [Nocardia brasiliensis]|uniref:Uncharacterized protein n=1 Tax=Nocardia brasiliensis (strain ATCC 700358 / HUJEG-1) TaxID=1133849 RepID=K0EY07_NOCB7|nr:hypothetical protein [Nocardia brasiliensis]AFU00471.1 hypothetical protein O3I_012550 [Nocardia brasiliensis ATCC 700358]OCF83772.1 hypothetical protein AW168_01150 [Nocardia brasiliensis]
MSTNRRRRLSADPLDNAAANYESPRPTKRFWTDQNGTTWRRRGRDLLVPSRARRLLQNPDTVVFHDYIGAAHEVVGQERADLVHEVEEFCADRAHARALFLLTEFRDTDHRVMVMIEEHC